MVITVSTYSLLHQLIQHNGKLFHHRELVLFMRKQAEWMGKWDDRFLEFINENGSGAPTEIANSDYITVSKQYISRRLNELAENGLLRPLGNGVYQITLEGTLYLFEDYDAESGEVLVDIDDQVVFEGSEEQRDEIMKYSYLDQLDKYDMKSKKVEKYKQLGLINEEND